MGGMPFRWIDRVDRDRVRDEPSPSCGSSGRRDDQLSWTPASADDRALDRVALGQRGLGYERLDQLVIELLLGVR